MNTSPVLVIAYIVGFILLYIVCRIFIRPIKWLFRLGISCTCGCVVMSALNYLLSGLGTVFSINPLTAMISGVLGIPGIVITFILQGIL